MEKEMCGHKDFYPLENPAVNGTTSTEGLFLEKSTRKPGLSSFLAVLKTLCKVDSKKLTYEFIISLFIQICLVFRQYFCTKTSESRLIT